MGLPNVFDTGHSAMRAAKAAIATGGHNIANANTEGFTRQRVETETQPPQPGIAQKGAIGRGTKIADVSRINDEYLDKQLRHANKQMNHFEEKDMMLRQLEDVFNELDGEGLNRMMSRFFNEFRNLANEPDSEPVRQ